MPRSLFEIPLVFAQDSGNPSWLFLYVLVPVFIAYFIIMRPQRRQEQKRRSMLEAIKKNDRVVTAGGIYGTVISVDPAQDRVVLRIDDEKGVKVTFAKSSLARVLETAPDKPSES